MGIATEKRLKRIEDMLQELKATYMISGGSMKLYESVSPVFTNSQSFRVRIKFTPNYNVTEDIIVSSIFYEFVNSSNISYNFSQYAFIEPQDNNNYIVFNVPALSGTIRLRIISTVPGTFTRIS